MSAKRSRNDIEIESIIESVPLDKGLVDGLLQHQRLHFCAKKTRIELPSFSAAKWSDFAEQFGLPLNVLSLKLEPFTTPRYHLPPSLHETMFENAWHWQDVYREKVDHTREDSEARVRILDPYLVPIVALFQGRIIDKPEQSMIETKYSTGGEVEHEIFTIGDALFFVIELDRPDGNTLAQLFLQLLSAAEMNKSVDFKGLRIYGLLTDLTQFKFYSYDPTANQFCFDETIIIDNKRINTFPDMMDVSNKIFGVVLSTYIDSLRAKITMIKNRARQNKASPSAMYRSRKSTDQWESALALAEECCTKFKEPIASLLDFEEKANEALNLLTKSVRSIPRASTFTGGDDDPSTPAELKALATRITRKAHEHYLSKA